MKTYSKIAVALVSALALLASASVAYAAFTPYLAVSSVGGTSVQVNVTGADPSASVFLYYTPSTGGALQYQVLGGTDANGSFTTVVNSSTYSIASGASSYVIVDGQQSPIVSWPATGTGSNTYLTLSQSTVSLSVGQTSTVTAYGGTGSVYVSSNSNSSVAGISVSGTTINITGINPGSTTVNLCLQSNSSYCATLNIAVGGSSSSAISFSSSNVFLSTGQNQTVNIYGGGQYTMSSNSNPNVVSTTINGGALTLYAVGTGSATVSICQSGSSSCGTVYVTVNGGTTSGSITFSQTSPSVSATQSTTVTIYGGSGTYYVSSNSNPGAVGISLSGSTLTLTGSGANQSSSIIICSSANTCGTLNVTVGNSTTPVTFSQSNVVVNASQSVTVNLYGNGGYSISGSQSSSAASATVSGSTIIISGLNPGAASFTVCSAGGACGQISVQVNAAGSVSSGGGTGITLGQISFSIPAGGTTLFAMNGASSYSISSNSNPSIASVSINGSALNIQAISVGTDAATICQSGGACVPLVVIVIQPLVVSTSNGGGVSTTTIPPASGSGSSSGFKFYNPLSYGSTGADVTALQERLIQLGYLNAAATGYYGSATVAAVKQYQNANGITPLGSVGPATRASLNG